MLPKKLFDEIVAQIKSEIDEVRIDTDSEGIMIKADTLGSLRLLVHEFQKDEIPIRKAEVGDISHHALRRRLSKTRFIP